MGRNDILARLAVNISANIAEFQKGTSQATKSLQAFEKTATGVSNQLKSAIGVVSFGLIAKQVIDVTSEFQKFEAVLTNTLGSSSAAQKSLNDIKDFAARTPFSVQELTGSFVKLANQGFKPTTEELRKLGDLASSTGKGFDQLAEAIIDAQTGEFERLKEFGIRASKSGDQVKFTFKGVQTQTKFTADAIRDYVLSLGDAEGVSGSMAAISQTLGGRISNLGDAFDGLLLSIGNSSSGPLNAIIESLTAITNAAANLGDELALKTVSYGLRSFNGLADTTLDYLIKFGKTNSGKAVAEVLAPITSQSNQQFFDHLNKNFREFTSLLEKEGESVDEITALWAHYLKNRQLAGEADNAAAAQARIAAVAAAKAQAEAYFNLTNSQGLIERINLQLEELETKKKKAFEVADVTRFNDEIASLKEKLDQLNVSTNNLSSFGKKVFNQEAGTTKVEEQELKPPDFSELGTSFNEVDILPGLTKWLGAFALIKAGARETSAAQTAANNISEDEMDAIAAKQERMKDLALDVGQAFGNAAADVMSGNSSIGQSIARLVSQMLPKFFALAVAGITAGATQTAAIPPVALALAAAGIAGISAIFAKIGHSGGASGGGGGSAPVGTNVSRTATVANGQQIFGDVKFQIEGTKLVGVLANQTSRSQITG